MGQSALLRLAGCEVGDLAALVRDEGRERALAAPSVDGREACSRPVHGRDRDSFYRLKDSSGGRSRRRACGASGNGASCRR